MNNRIRLALSTLALGSILAAATCSGNDASDAWRQVLRKCAEGDQVANLLFFSFSSNIGPGSLWRKTEDNGYLAVRRSPPELEPIVNHGQPNSCEGVSEQFSDFSAEAGVQQFASLVPASSGLDLSKAQSVVLSTPSWAWDEIFTGEFQDFVNDLPAGASYARDLLRHRLVMGRALRVNGYRASITFSQETAASLKASYPGVAEGAFSAKWSDKGTLDIESTGPAYVAVQMYRWGEEGGLAATGLIQLTHTQGERIVSERPQGGES